MTSPSTIECARAVAERRYSFVYLKQIGTLQTSNALFKEMISNPTYRSQCLHHSAVLDTPYILYVFAKGSCSAQGSILYTVLLTFSQQLRNMYLCTLDCIRTSAFDCIGLSEINIPLEYDDMLKSTHATDLSSLCAHYNIGQALRKKVKENSSPLLPCRQLRPTALIF